jgi:hypothetical protein
MLMYEIYFPTFMERKGRYPLLKDRMHSTQNSVRFSADTRHFYPHYCLQNGPRLTEPPTDRVLDTFPADMVQPLTEFNYARRYELDGLRFESREAETFSLLYNVPDRLLGSTSLLILFPTGKARKTCS